jgi:hypothetical protein
MRQNSALYSRNVQATPSTSSLVWPKARNRIDHYQIRSCTGRRPECVRTDTFSVVRTALSSSQACTWCAGPIRIPTRQRDPRVTETDPQDRHVESCSHCQRSQAHNTSGYQQHLRVTRSRRITPGTSPPPCRGDRRGGKVDAPLFEFECPQCAVRGLGDALDVDSAAGADLRECVASLGSGRGHRPLRNTCASRIVATGLVR